MNIGILNMNKGNLKSLFQSLNKINNNYNLYIIENLKDLDKIDKLILSGQTNCLSYLNYLLEYNYINKLIDFLNYKHVLGICAAFQLNFLYNYENNVFCLNNELGYIKKFLENKIIKIPYIGWNKLKSIKNNSFINYDLNYFYFSNSFYLNILNYNNIYFISNYIINFPSIYFNNNLILTQFHPEKSGLLGINFFNNFLNL